MAGLAGDERFPTSLRCHSSPSKKALRPSVNSDWCVCMPEPFSPKIGFGMKVVAGLLRDLLDDQPVGERVVGHVERRGEPHGDLVLQRADLVVDVLDRDPHRRSSAAMSCRRSVAASMVVIAK